MQGEERRGGYKSSSSRTNHTKNNKKERDDRWESREYKEEIKIVILTRLSDNTSWGSGVHAP